MDESATAVTARLRVGLPLLFLREDSGGPGRYAVELIGALLREEPRLELTVFVTRSAPARLTEADWAPAVRWVTIGPGHGHVPWHLLNAQLGVPAHGRRRLDLVHGPANTVPLVTPGVRRVMTLHDVTWLRHPEIEPNPARRAVMHCLAMAGARRADRVITGSLASRADIAGRTGIDPGRIDVVPLGVSAGTVAATPELRLRERYALGGRPVVLCVAQMRPHKNLERLVRAATEARGDAVVLLVGTVTPHARALRELIDELGLGDRVRIAGWVPEADLEGLYRMATCFVLPSLNEGFGLPVLEAMARGLPVACSDIPALREVGGPAALYFDPCDPTAIAGAIDRLLGDPAQAALLAGRGRAQAAARSWAHTARATLETYRRVALRPAV